MSFSMTGADAADCRTAVKEVIHDHALLVGIDGKVTRIGTTVDAVKGGVDAVSRNVASIAACLAEDIADQKERASTLEGRRREEFREVCEIVKAEPEISFWAACRRVKLDGRGYPNWKSLHRYCCENREVVLAYGRKGGAL